jgi:hypothetical protein
MVIVPPVFRGLLIQITRVVRVRGLTARVRRVLHQDSLDLIMSIRFKMLGIMDVLLPQQTKINLG